MTKQATNRTTTDSPCVSVVMPVYNGEPYLREAVESILNQTFTDFEFIIIDDGSTDDSWQILSAYAARDARIRLVHNQENIGQTSTLNKGLAQAQGKYIARQDADDVSLPERLVAQVAYLERHHDIGLLGTAYYRLYESEERSLVLCARPAGRAFTPGDSATTRLHPTSRPEPKDTGQAQFVPFTAGWASPSLSFAPEVSLRQPPLTDTELRWRLLFSNVWCHASMMIRRQLFENCASFDPKFEYAQDYELWTRLLNQTRGATLTQPLVIYRVHENSLTATRSEARIREPAAVSARQIKALLPQRFTPSEIEALRRCCMPQQLTQQDMASCPLMFELFKAFTQQPGIDPITVRRLRRQWIKWVLAAIRIQQWPLLLTSGLLGAILRHDPIAVLIAGLIHFPKRTIRQRTIRQISRAKIAVCQTTEVANVPSDETSAAWHKGATT